MNYCLVENNAIVDGPRGLPRSWRNISGLNWLSDHDLRPLGWLPSRIEEGIVDEKFVGSTFTITETEVIETKQWRKFTAEEQAEIEAQKAKQVRSERNAKLTETDWTQVDDTPLDNVAKNAWANYRQALRDVPDQAGFPFDVNWPSVPV
jgi:hypothetical protein